MSWRRRASALLVVTAFLLPLVVSAQRGGFGRGRQTYATNPPYDGRFTFTRIRYSGGGFGRGAAAAWSHDYPDADRNLPLILKELTAIPTNVEPSNILDLEDPEIFRNPILYVWEPGYWRISDEAATNLRAYMLKGGLRDLRRLRRRRSVDQLRSSSSGARCRRPSSCRSTCRIRSITRSST